ncbi:diguanylate cyclase [Shewanella avicenniae]|uniref:diguanylate cyclase n=1 Tax=Shewanella avicenniae TaxID=2814294 RepID=A0ABX7QNJ6_9GAMM|nr:diguanylate cyclase [Shewanella avicenniae]QSX32560.1 diguanylate cyclase [Shewanella avicenniae]
MSRSRSRLSNIRNFYLLFFMTIVGWVALAYVTMEQLISEESTYAELINISGKQRMLSQRATLYAMTSRSNDELTAKREVSNALREMLANHEFILDNSSTSVVEKYFFSEPYVIDETLKVFIDTTKRLTFGADDFDINNTLKTSDELLKKLDAAVNEYQRDAEVISTQLLERELLILVGSIVTLSLEYLFLFLPIFRELKENEQQLVKANETFDKIVRNSPDGTQIISRDGKLKFYSDLSRQRLGYTDEEMLNLRIADWDCGLSALEIDLLVKSLSYNETSLFETKHRTKNGDTYDALISAKLIDLDGEPYIYASVKDITHLNQMRRLSNIDALKLRVAAESANMGIWEWDLSSGKAIWDHKMCQIFEVKAPLSFEEWQSYIVEDDRARVVREIQDALDTNGSFRTDYCVQLPNGIRKRLESSAKPMLDDEGNVTLRVGTIRDISDAYRNNMQLKTLNYQLSQAQALAKIGHWEFNHITQELYWSDEIYTIFSIDREKVKPSLNLYLSSIHPDDRPAFDDIYQTSIRTKKPYDVTHRFVLSDGSIKFAREIGQTVFSIDGKPKRTMGTVQDVTEQQLSQIKSEHHLNLIDQYIITSETDLNGVITDVSSAFCKLCGYSKEELIGNTHKMLSHPDTPRFYYEALWKALLRGDTWHGEIQNRDKSGQCYWLASTYSPSVNAFGQIVGYMEISQDITARKLAEDLSIKDQLTGLYNRLHIDRMLAIEVERSRRYGGALSLILLDIDHFKSINDTYGHLEGDQVLKHLARLLQSYCRKSDCVGRWGGEEFIVICPNTNSKAANVLAEKLRQAIAEQHIPTVGHISASFGVTERGSDETNFKYLIERADKALYQAKDQGRNKVVVGLIQVTPAQQVEMSNNDDKQ